MLFYITCIVLFIHCAMSKLAKKLKEERMKVEKSKLLVYVESSFLYALFTAVCMLILINKIGYVLFTSILFFMHLFLYLLEEEFLYHIVLITVLLTYVFTFA